MRNLTVFAICAFGGLTALCSAQELTGRYTELNYTYVYGAGGDSHSGSDSVVDNILLQSDSEHLDFSGSTSGTLSGNPYTAGVSTILDTDYSVLGALTNFQRVTASASSWGTAPASGPGLGLMISANPGNQTIMSFNVANSMEYRLQGSIFGGETGAGHLVALQRWDGITWQQVYTSWSLPGLQGSFDVTGTLGSGQYRMLSQIAFKADTNETWSNGYNYTLTAVPEPVTALGLLPALWFMRRRKRCVW